MCLVENIEMAKMKPKEDCPTGLELLDKIQDFSGCKIALINGDEVLTILRDDIPTIPYPNTWDLAGGGRENNETPLQCVQREVREELGLRLAREDIFWVKEYPGMLRPDTISIFMVGQLKKETFEEITFGDEGQTYRMMKIVDFIESEQVINSLRQRVKDYLDERKRN